MPRKVSASAQAAREGTLDMLSARSSAVRARLGNDDNVSIDYIEACGDCFYLAIESALSEICGWQPYYAVGTQRQLVASQMNEETFQLYELLYAQQAEGEDARAVVRACSLRARAPVAATVDTACLAPARPPLSCFDPAARPPPHYLA